MTGHALCFFRYFLRVTIVRRLSDITREMDLLVHTLSSYPEMNNSIKMEVGIEDCLHIEFEYNKSKWVQYVWLEKHGLIFSLILLLDATLVTPLWKHILVRYSTLVFILYVCASM